ncbi:hypothetical protein [Pseudomonas cichorii]|uniref:hypothetical protein n=1 Tax=Pseudomonas cichorii TaxID=36746 RepID=UPI001C8A2C56|nr:hypothetical protein [Pseudomonas cichorii]MBX8574911.1 hypothetical protein [Pseudomonas cichorii]
MAFTTVGIKLDERTRARVKAASQGLERTPHWFMKLAIQRLLKEVEAGAQMVDLLDGDTLPSDQERYSTNPLVNPRAVREIVYAQSKNCSRPLAKGLKDDCAEDQPAWRRTSISTI